MKHASRAVFGLALVLAVPAFAANTAPASQTAASNAAHVKDVQELLGAMHIEKVLMGTAARSRYQSEAQKQAVFAKLAKTPPAEVYQRMAPPLAHVISDETAIEMTRFYNTPYGKQVIHDRYNSRPQFVMPGMIPAVPAEEKQERKRAAYVKASKELADAQAVIDHQAFVLVQQINSEKR